LDTIKNSAFTLQLSDRGVVERLLLAGDREQMNWVIDPAYIRACGYPDEDKLFGHFTVRVNGTDYISSQSEAPRIERVNPQRVDVIYAFSEFEVHCTYDLESGDSLGWQIALNNKSKEDLTIESFFVWSSVAYVMFKDPNVLRNISQSCAVFPSISENFSKFACVRRSNQGPHLGMYALQGSTQSMGTYCRFENNFFKNVSPSLDGLLYHQLVLVGQGTDDPAASESDWIYMRNAASLQLRASETQTWEYRFLAFDDQKHFYENAAQLGHPVIEYLPVMTAGGLFRAVIQLEKYQKPVRVWLESCENRELSSSDLTDLLKFQDGRYELSTQLKQPGERKLSILLDNGKTDSIVFNVMEPVKEIIEARADYICNHLYAGENGEAPYAFLPLSNQGESLGKAALVLMKNLLGDSDPEQIQKVENSAVHYIRAKWFHDGVFAHPINLYGDFYRIFDFDYVAHVYYLLSKFNSDQLTHNRPEDYLKWAAEVMIMRMDADMHEAEREKKETQMLGVYVLFIRDLMEDLAGAGLTGLKERLGALWTSSCERIRAESADYKGAVTEHFYDNAGFGPTCEALCLSGHLEEAEKYGELLLANIGFSNDFRAQNPDRWWESLSYMTHSLWGGLVAASTLIGYEHFRKNDYLLAAYRAAMAVFYCYDWNATATTKKLEKGEAASTFSVAAPNLNRPDLSRNRFGQSVFTEAEGEIFKGLFDDASGYDWDMGEELVAYLSGFGTKTFLYYDGGEVRCANGELVKEGDRYIVTSYAAYPTQFHFYEENASYITEPGEKVRTIIFEKGSFKHEKLQIQSK
jgi:hypothetical protein